MSTAQKTGMSALTQTLKHICRLLTRFRPAMTSVINQAVTFGTITSGQAGTLNAFLDGAQVACDILRLITRY
jgi:hypothetical protein